MMYRINLDGLDAASRAWFDGNTRSLITAGILVPVEPDYEAAERAIDIVTISTTINGKPALGMVERSQSEAARLAVDAAYRTAVKIEETP